MNMPKGGMRRKEHETNDDEASTASEGTVTVSNVPIPREKAAEQSANGRVFTVVRSVAAAAQKRDLPETRTATLRPVAILEGTQVKVTSAQPQFLFPTHSDPHTVRLAPDGHCARGCERLEVGAPTHPGPPGPWSRLVQHPAPLCGRPVGGGQGCEAGSKASGRAL